MPRNANAFPSVARSLRDVQRALGPVFARRELERAGLGDRALLERLVRAGYVRRASRGLYEIVEEPRVRIAHEFVLALGAVPASEEAYISWRSALAHWGLTEQMPRVVYVAVQHPRLQARLGGARVQFVVQAPARRYDLREAVVSGSPVRIASAEKAVLDALDRPDLSGGLDEVVRALASRSSLDYGHLVGLGLRHPSAALARRLGYLMTVLGLSDPGALLARVRPGDNPLRLDLDGPATDAYDRAWRVIDNVGASDLRDMARA